MPHASAEPPFSTARRSPAEFVGDYANQIWAVAAAEITKLRRDPVELVSRATQPILWLVLFGSVMGRVRGMNTGALSYQDFLAPGILAQSVLFAAIFYGIAAIWERDLGISAALSRQPRRRAARSIARQGDFGGDPRA